MVSGVPEVPARVKEVMYPAEVFSASVQTSKQDSTAPEASTPSGAEPAEQFAPLAARAVAVEARVARSIVILFGTWASVTAPCNSCSSSAASRVASVVASIASRPLIVPVPVRVRVGVEIVPAVVTA